MGGGKLARVIVAALLGVMLTGCGGSGAANAPASASAAPTSQATATPAATLSPSPTPSPSPTVTPAPTVALTPYRDVFDQIISKAETGGWPKVTATDVTDSISAAYAADPAAAAIQNPATSTAESAVVTRLWNTCRSNVKADPDVSVLSCAGLIGHLYWEGYAVVGKAAWLDAISTLVAYVHAQLSARNWRSFSAYAVNGEGRPF